MSELYEEWCGIMNQTPNERDRIIFDAGMTFHAIEARHAKPELKPMTAEIKKTVYGDCYFQITAYEPHDKLTLEELKRQLFDKDREISDFGGAGAHDEVLGRSADYMLGMISREKSKPPEKKRRWGK